MFLLTCRRLLSGLPPPTATPPFAQNDTITVRPGGLPPDSRIAVANFAGGHAARLFSSVISRQFQAFGFLQPIDPAAFPNSSAPTSRHRLGS